MKTTRWLAIAIALALSACAPAVSVRTDARERLASGLDSAVSAPRALPPPGAAYEDLPPGELDPAAAVAFGLHNDPRVRVELARLDIAQAERIQAGLVSNPMASLMAMRPSGGGRFELDYSLMQSLYDLFARSRRVAAADARQRQVEAQVMARLLDFARVTELAYYRAVNAQALLDIERRELLLQQEALALFQAKARSGSATVQASIAQQAAVSMQAHEVEAAHASLSDARGGLASALGLPSAQALELPWSLPASALPPLQPQALQELAAARSPDLASARRERDAVLAESRLESGSALQTLDPALGLAGTRESDGMRMDGLEVQVRVPVFDQGQGRSALAAAKAQQAQAQVESAERQLSLDVERALAALLAAESAALHASHHLREQQTLERLSARNYAVGAGSFEDWLQARGTRLDAERDLSRARLSASEAAVELRRVTASAALDR